MEGILTSTENAYNIEDLKNQKKSIELKIKSEKKKISIIKENPELASFISSSANNLDFKNTSQRLSQLHKNIADLKKQRNREENRKLKLINLVAELRSLNRNLKEGNVICSDCGSEKIIFANKEFEFEVSNDYVRKNILKSIEENILIKEESVTEYNDEILKEQEQIKSLLQNSSTDAKNYILFQDSIIDSKDIDKIVVGLQQEFAEIQKMIDKNESKIVSDKDAQRNILYSILKEMRRYYDRIDPDGTLVFEDLFTKNKETYSGSEEQEYYFCKILALNNILRHNYPIIIDSFREGELSSNKETLMIQEFIKLNKQVILTSTLKNEEYISEKYFNQKEINVLDYSKVEDSKILQPDFAVEFNEIVEKFNIQP
ncbi:hypothetical protein [Salegentibacter maritimus]|uniref:Uncharacterized protein n=1 Tax=Salegentibacter maritimus TaxID=2794347 RepID=A0ABS0TGD6_9FLAO|nr:hypothetical protein [Salegentibacter maritimus]MBI6120118.1 hypothetical protein [Salegentibacter maritimus]